MRIIPALALLALAPACALALPGEDHWSREVSPAERAALEESRALIEAGRAAEALPILTELAKALPSNADVFNLLGFAHRKTGDLTTSGAHYVRALYLDPDHLGALEYQGELFLMQGNTERAAANLRRLEALCPERCEERDELEAAIEAQRAE
ncbi:MAG: tetratricopeptide repeat protein [Pikeienuella sp.]|uniref:tetratricopeptide repeat protein n=1 Tax=Pikeienuella sp. TaxID=2831957 RepID=UPI00391B9DDD